MQKEAVLGDIFHITSPKNTKRQLIFKLIVSSSLAHKEDLILVARWVYQQFPKYSPVKIV